VASKALANALKTDQTFVKAVEPVDQDIKDWVEACHKEWLKDQEAWREITFATREDLDSTLEDARRYTNEIRKPALTVQTSGQPEAVANGVRLVYRVRTKVNSGRPRGSRNGTAGS
jgi:hypothetical protein